MVPKEFLSRNAQFGPQGYSSPGATSSPHDWFRRSGAQKKCRKGDLQDHLGKVPELIYRVREICSYSGRDRG